MPLAWPWLVFASLMIFQWSMRRSKVRPIHSLRCTIYSGGTLLWVGLVGLVLLLAAVGMGKLSFSGPGVRKENLLDNIVLALVGGLLLSMVYQLIVAYQRYMWFDHAAATVLSALVISLLAPFTVYMYVLAASY